MRVAALYVHKGGMYSGMADVDPWDAERDARLYGGPWPVVAHPPCSRWCQLAGLVQARYGHAVGDDGGCFEAALRDVRLWGGVLEHPAYSKAWPAFGLLKPPRTGGWVNAGDGIGWTCHVEQAWYGHPARKATWLYAVDTDFRSLRWGPYPKDRLEATVGYCDNRGEFVGRKRYRLPKKQAAQTPEAFRDLLLSLAESVWSTRACKWLDGVAA